jgi:hypothetical protein
MDESSDSGVKNGTRPNLADLMRWFQEHALLCSEVTQEVNWSEERKQAWKELLLTSTHKGKALAKALKLEEGEGLFQKLQDLVPVAGSALNRTAIPLSGMRRFEEPSQIAIPRVHSPSRVGTPVASAGSNVVGNSVAMASNSNLAPSNLMPSKTYIKKS